MFQRHEVLRADDGSPFPNPVREGLPTTHRGAPVGHCPTNYRNQRLRFLAREDCSVWPTRSLPAVRPIPVREVEPSLSLSIMKGVVHGEGAGGLVQFQHEKARLR